LLQSRLWMEVLRQEGKKIIELSYGNDILFGVEQPLPVIGAYAYFPRLCALSESMTVTMATLSYNWVRADVCDDAMLKQMHACGKKIIKAPHDMQPRQNLIVDITLSEEELLARMKSKTRYNVRLAQKKGVEVFATREKKHIDVFCNLVEETARRKHIVAHKRSHYHVIFAHMPPEVMQLYVARYNDRIIAANMVSFYNGVATYLHGATADKYRNVMAPFLLQWQAMVDAKKKGCVWYDFGGVFPADTDVGKQGITRFKTGFAPHVQPYTTQGSYDMVLSPSRYKMYHILQKTKKII